MGEGLHQPPSQGGEGSRPGVPGGGWWVAWPIIYSTALPAVGGRESIGRPDGEEKDSKPKETMPPTSLRFPYHLSYRTILRRSTVIDLIHQGEIKEKHRKAGLAKSTW